MDGRMERSGRWVQEVGDEECIPLYSYYTLLYSTLLLYRLDDTPMRPMQMARNGTAGICISFYLFVFLSSLMLGCWFVGMMSGSYYPDPLAPACVGFSSYLLHL